MNENIELMLKQMADDFNRYSRSFALSCAEDKEFLQWNLGNMNSIGEYMVELARLIGVELKYGYDFEVYEREENREQEIKYRTVEIVQEGKQVEAD